MYHAADSHYSTRTNTLQLLQRNGLVHGAAGRLECARVYLIIACRDVGVCYPLRRSTCSSGLRYRLVMGIETKCQTSRVVEVDILAGCARHPLALPPWFSALLTQ